MFSRINKHSFYEHKMIIRILKVQLFMTTLFRVILFIFNLNNYSLLGFSVTIYNINTNTNISTKTIKYTNIYISTN